MELNQDTENKSHPQVAAQPLAPVVEPGALPAVLPDNLFDQSPERFVGHTILGHYRIVSVLGTGGMSVVYKAEHLVLHQFVAIKMLNSASAKSRTAADRFKQEAQSISRLNHDKIVRVKDFGVLPGGSPYLIMDFVEGKSLSDLVDGQPIAPSRALKICSQICEALAHAHAKGIVHRDIKPSNVIVADEGTPGETVRLVDFGIAKLLFEDELGLRRQALTTTGEAIGSPPYMSPEQANGGQLDARSDIYSTGCLLYELLTGAPPFCASSIFAVIHMHLTALPDPISKRNGKIKNSAELDFIILTALAKDAEKRFADAKAFSRALDAARSHLESANPWRNMQSKAKIIHRRLIGSRKFLPILCAAVVIPILVALLKPQTDHILRQGNSSQINVIDGKEVFSKAYRKGLALWTEGLYAQAEPQLKQAVLHSSAIGEENEQFQNALSKLADTYQRLGDAARAAEANRQLQNIKKFTHSLGDIDDTLESINQLAEKSALTAEDRARLAMLHTNLAELQLAQNEFDKALQSATIAVSISESLSFKDSANTAKAMQTLVSCLTQARQYDKAEQWLTRLWKINGSNGNHDPEQRANIWLLAGRLHLEQAAVPPNVTATPNIVLFDELPRLRPKDVANLDKAQSELSQAAHWYQEFYQGPSPQLAYALTQLAKAETFAGELDKARQHFQQAAQINTVVRGPDNDYQGRIAYNLGRLRNMQAQTGHTQSSRRRLLLEADEQLASAQDIFERRSSDLLNSQMLGETMNMRALVNANLGRFDQAEHLYKGSINLALGWQQRQCPTAVEAFHRLLRLYDTADLPQKEKDKRKLLLTRLVHSIDAIPPAAIKTVDDLDKPIGANDR